MALERLSFRLYLRTCMNLLKLMQLWTVILPAQFRMTLPLLIIFLTRSLFFLKV